MLMGGLFGRFAGALCGDLGLSASVSGVFAVVGSARDPATGRACRKFFTEGSDRRLRGLLQEKSH
ncbi:unnamed protein product [Symbiodinium microadriaticum]|nr:unnamed protein product [Symbiodinium microadriaticum]